MIFQPKYTRFFFVRHHAICQQHFFSHHQYSKQMRTNEKSMEMGQKTFYLSKKCCYYFNCNLRRIILVTNKLARGKMISETAKILTRLVWTLVKYQFKEAKQIEIHSYLSISISDTILTTEMTSNKNILLSNSCFSFHWTILSSFLSRWRWNWQRYLFGEARLVYTSHKGMISVAICTKAGLKYFKCGA